MENRSGFNSKQRNKLLEMRLNNSITYEDSLELLDITPNMFSRNIRNAIEDIAQNNPENEIVKNMRKFDDARRSKDREFDWKENKYCSLFKMNYETIKENYRKVLKEGARFSDGVLMNADNSYNLMKIAFDNYFGKFCGEPRETQTNMLRTRVKRTYNGADNQNIEKFMKQTKLESLAHCHPGIEANSRGRLLLWFDSEISKEYQQPRWFDLSIFPHEHIWDYMKVWNDDEIVFTAMLHQLEETIDGFRNAPRNKQLLLIEPFICPKTAKTGKYCKIWENGAGRVLSKRFDTIAEGMHFFDERYSTVRSQSPYFSKNEPIYLEKDPNSMSDRLRVVQAQPL
jgi:hypothetical protein